MPFDTFEDAVRITNSVEYGLVSVVFTQDQLKANRFVRAVEVGMVSFNSCGSFFFLFFFLFIFFYSFQDRLLMNIYHTPGLGEQLCQKRAGHTVWGREILRIRT